MLKHICAVCGGEVLFEESNVCDICGWEEDGVQEHDPDYHGGANLKSLNEAREAFKKGGGGAVIALAKATREERYGNNGGNI